MKMISVPIKLCLLWQITAAQTRECNPNLEVIQLQDVSNTFTDNIAGMKTRVGAMIAQMQVNYTSVRYGVATFSDKGLPQVGVGSAYGAWIASGYVMDHCYRLDLPLTSNLTKVSEVVGSLFTSGGEDFEESQMDALLNIALDDNVGWTTNNENVARIAVIVTDAFAHRPGYLQSQIDLYHAHYGVDDTISSWVYSDDAGNYPEWVRLKKKISNGEFLTQQEGVALSFLDARYLPFSRIEPATLMPFEYTAESYYANNMTCQQHDYPDVKDPGFAAAILAKGIIPVILAIPPMQDTTEFTTNLERERDQWIRTTLGPVYCPNVEPTRTDFFVKCTDDNWTNLMQELNVPAVVQIVPSSMATAEDFVNLMERTIDLAILELYCSDSTPAPSKEPIVIGTGASTVAHISDEGHGGSNPFGSIESSSAGTAVPTIVSVTMTTTKRPPPPPPTPQKPLATTTKRPPREGTSTTPVEDSNAIIIGAATAGALVAAAAVAGVLYMKGVFGGGGSSTLQTTIIENIDMADSPECREVVAEVDYGMFA